MPHALSAMPWGRVALGPGLLQRRFELNRAYMLSLKSEALLQNFYLEAGLVNVPQRPEGWHWGWESPSCQLRGHFLGHWLSAAARTVAATGDPEMRAKAERIVAELGRCQQENGGEWAGSIPEKYFDWIARGKRVWAPHYTVHKTLMGLYEMGALAGCQQALDILARWAGWFYRWTGQFTRDQLDDILDVETGGMLEVWADLYGLTGAAEHRELIERYDRRRLFDALLRGEDPLTNRHANTTIPEAQGAARAWEVTGEPRYRAIVDAYWRQAVTERAAYCTGGQTAGEFWTPKGELSARLGSKNQEHCTVYNLMRLAEYLLRWTGDPAYADYWERNLYNGILAQQHPQTGQIAYFLPLGAGLRKEWGTPTETFWCCHGTLVQAHPTHVSAVFYGAERGLAVAQYLPTTLHWEREDTPVQVTLRLDGQARATRQPQDVQVEIRIDSEHPATFELALRLPWWLAGEATATVDGAPVARSATPTSWLRLTRVWCHDTIRLTLPKRLSACPLPDRPDTVAFMDGPVALAGLCDEERTLAGDPAHPEALLVPDNEREFDTWLGTYRTVGQARGLRFKPLYEVIDEPYTVYWPVRG